MPEEVDTWPFFEYAWGIGKTVVVPVSTPAGLVHTIVTRDTQWQTGAFGIQEPIASSTPVQSIDVVIVPVVAFDSHCNRIGYGKGYYDRFLHEHGAITMGLAYECQKVNDLPTEQHDVALSCIATDQRWYIR